jgi:effector-binding domain-containing protein
MDYTIHVKQVPPQVVASERRHTAAAELGTVMQSTLARIALAVEPPDASQGVPFAIYYSAPSDPADLDVEVGVPIASDATLAAGARVQRRELPGGPVAFTFHEGPYETIGSAYAALFGWVTAQGHRPLGPPREIYLVGPGQGTRPGEYRTEIDLPIE